MSDGNFIPLCPQYESQEDHPPLSRFQLEKKLVKSLTQVVRHLQGDLKTIPKKWEMVGPIALFPPSAFEGWPFDVWPLTRSFLDCRAVARQDRITKEAIRTPQVEILDPVNADSEVVHCDNGVRYVLDVKTIMFSRGNIKEKLRVADFKCRGETILDCYAGIGYWAFPLVMYAEAHHVVCCELNPKAAEYCHLGAKANRIEKNITILEGNNASEQTDLALKNFVFDRAILGLIPSSENAWPVVSKHLRRDRVTYAHVHANVENETRFVADVVARWTELCHRKVSCMHVERVKWYAPHVRHCVLDLRVEACQAVSN